MADRVHDVAVIGAGLGGLGAAMKLREAGFGDLVVLEKGDGIGGTWRDNTYPGCACDVPSALYSWSFAPKPDWSRLYAGQREILGYIRDVADAMGVLGHVRPGSEVLEASWDAEAACWDLDTTAGALRARAVVSATGPWNEPNVPELPGLSGFAGDVFHSSRWDHGVELRGRRVAVVGTGASAVQFVPAIQPYVNHLTLFQRTPQWVLPKPDRATSGVERLLLERLPFATRLQRLALDGLFELLGLAFRHPRGMAPLQRIARLHLARSVADPVLREALTPTYTLGCKRLLLSNDWYPTLTRENVDVVPHAVAEVRPDGVVGSDGVFHAADVLILGTGFRITDPPVAKRVRGRDGRTLDEVWSGSPAGYLGTTVSGFPNFFILLGPNIGNGHGSAVVLHEAQIGYVVDALKATRGSGRGEMDVRADVQRAFNDEVQAALAKTVWNAGGCSSYYLDRNGRNSTMYPWSTIHLRRRLRDFAPADYR